MSVRESERAAAAAVMGELMNTHLKMYIYIYVCAARDLMFMMVLYLGHAVEAFNTVRER